MKEATAVFIPTFPIGPSVNPSGCTQDEVEIPFQGCFSINVADIYITCLEAEAAGTGRCINNNIVCCDVD